MRVWHESVPADGPEVLVFTPPSSASRIWATSSRIAHSPPPASRLRRAGRSAAGRASDRAALRRAGGAARDRWRRDHARAWSSAPTAHARRCANSSASRCARMTTGRAPSSRPSRPRGRTSSPPGNASWAPDRWRCCHCSTAAARSSGRPTNALAEELMALPPDEFARRLDAASDGVLGATHLVSERARLAAAARHGDPPDRHARRAGRRRRAPRYIRWLGRASTSASSMRRRCARCWPRAWPNARIPGAARLLIRYEQQRADARHADELVDERLQRAAGARRRPGGWLAARLLGLAGAAGIARRGFARQALGLAGEVPRLARSVPAAAA